jgi:putative restriction endonuclease
MNAFESLYALNTGIIGTGRDRHERPHKPILLLAALEQIQATGDPTRVLWTQSLRARFKQLFAVVAKHNDRANPELPFFHLRSDTFWSPMRLDGTPLAQSPKARDCDLVCASLSPEMAQLLATPSGREAVRSALIARYFPLHALALSAPAQETQAAESLGDFAASMPKRSGAFRKKILEIYRHQCAACGLQMFEPVSLVDAAHLVPFSEGANDHPTNGLSLCKNHHWAMDQQLIAPTHEATWAVSPVLIPKRSNGEAKLASLAGESLLAPNDEAYMPSAAGIEYRLSALRHAAAHQ